MNVRSSIAPNLCWGVTVAASWAIVAAMALDTAKMAACLEVDKWVVAVWNPPGGGRRQCGLHCSCVVPLPSTVHQDPAPHLRPGSHHLHYGLAHWVIHSSDSSLFLFLDGRHGVKGVAAAWDEVVTLLDTWPRPRPQWYHHQMIYVWLQWTKK